MNELEMAQAQVNACKETLKACVEQLALLDAEVDVARRGMDEATGALALVRNSMEDPSMQELQEAQKKLDDAVKVFKDCGKAAQVVFDAEVEAFNNLRSAEGRFAIAKRDAEAGAA